MTIEQVLQGLTLPFVTGELPGIGGSIKQIPEHFIVEEVPLYAAEGSGPHVYINLTRAGWTKRDVAIKPTPTSRAMPRPTARPWPRRPFPCPASIRKRRPRASVTSCRSR